MLIIGLCLGSMAGAAAQRVSPVAEASQACKCITRAAAPPPGGVAPRVHTGVGV